MLRPESNPSHHGVGGFLPFRFRLVGVDEDRFLDDCANLLSWVQRAKWVLEDHLDGAADLPTLGLSDLGQIVVGKHNTARGWLLDHRDEARESRLAAT